MRRTAKMACVLLLALAGLTSGRAASPTGQDFQPDPKSVQRYGPAYRYPQAGWIVLHIEGEPYQRGYQHGRLLASEIAANIRCYATVRSHKDPEAAWRLTRSLVNSLFMRRYEKEYLEEMKGIADGATAAGAKFDNRPIDLLDIVTVNSWAEYDTLDGALEALPTGLEGMRFPQEQPRPMPKPKDMHCSAFAATGPATADGKVVFGHITMFGLYPSNFFNVWLDVKPAKGHRVLMQTYPGGIQSGLDYYLNDAGIIVTETTIAQTQFDVTGKALASRIRQALQYADSIDKAVEILRDGNNGLYTNEWLLANVKTNEIAMLELGTHKSRLRRSSKNEWVGGTTGFYWGCNNTKDLQVRLETIPGVNDRPHNMVFHSADRDKVWIELYERHKGKIDADFGKLAFTTPPLAAYHSLDAKFTTTDMARDLKTWALFGPPLGRTWQPRQDERQHYPEVKPLVSNPWTILHGGAPAQKNGADAVAVDLKQLSDEGPRRDVDARRNRDERRRPSVAAWHGTILPMTDNDIWLAAAFADYERIYSADRQQAKDSETKPEDRQRLGESLFGYRSRYLVAARVAKETPLAETKSDLAQNEWYGVAAGKGVLLMHELRKYLGDNTFEETMDSFGRANAGKQVTSDQFFEHVTKMSGKTTKDFSNLWFRQPGLPTLRLSAFGVSEIAGADGKSRFTVLGQLTAENCNNLAVDITVETESGEETKRVALFSEKTSLEIGVKHKPRRLIVDKYGTTARANGGIYSIYSFLADLRNTLIVYGTTDEMPTNREAADALQQALRERGPNVTVPIKPDSQVTPQEMASNHLLLIGRPNSNSVVATYRQALPISFGTYSFTVGNDSYAHADSAVIAAADNPANKRYSMVVLAGLSAASTLEAAPTFGLGWRGAEVLILPHGGQPKSVIVPPKELVQELTEKVTATSKK